MTIEKLNRINTVLLAFLTIAYLHLLWLLFTILGGVIFGAGPATYAMMKYYDRWLRLKEQPSVTKSFIFYFKERYRQSLLVSWLYGLLLLILVTNIFSPLAWYFQVANVLVLIIIHFIFTHVYTVMAATKFVTIKEILRGSALLGLGYLHYSIISWTILIGGYFLASRYLPALLFFFGFGFAGLVLAIPGKMILQEMTPKQAYSQTLEESAF
ncbi:YesL family protein [Enterococcus gallinarum]|uniref:YesL family protein n=1 Tax=Enterococcus gallinarum TaxID=1353 RepID=UPI002433A7A0|nr:YesL family protein [Enterococcus gallinarum]